MIALGGSMAYCIMYMYHSFVIVPKIRNHSALRLNISFKLNITNIKSQISSEYYSVIGVLFYLSEWEGKFQGRLPFAIVAVVMKKFIVITPNFKGLTTKIVFILLCGIATYIWMHTYIPPFLSVSLPFCYFFPSLNALIMSLVSDFVNRSQVTLFYYICWEMN